MIRFRSTPMVRRWLAGLAVLALVGVALIPTASVAAVTPANPVTDWNLNTINAIGNPPDAAVPGLGQPPPPAVVHLAMVQGAVYDAVNAIDGGHQPYLGGLPSMPDASEAAAVATAAHDVLVALPPLPGGNAAPMRASVAELYRVYMLDIPDGSAKEQGIALGRAAAAAMLAARTDDGRPGTSLWPIGTLPGQWRPVGPNNANVFATTKNIDTFSIKRSDQFRTEGPPDMASAEYAAAFNEVKSTGEKNSPRTDAQNRLASFVSANPFGPFHRALREIALAKGLSTADQALLFVKTSIAAADAFIACWDDKDHWLFWRPQTAIQLADTDGNPATVADPNWTALFPIPGIRTSRPATTASPPPCGTARRRSSGPTR